MIRKSGYRFSEKIMLKQKALGGKAGFLIWIKAMAGDLGFK